MQKTNKPLFFASDVSLRLDIPLKKRIEVLLNRLGKSQNWLADQVGVSKGTMSKIVNGSWYPTSRVMIMMAEVLDIDSVFLFGDSKYWRHWCEKMNYEGDENV